MTTSSKPTSAAPVVRLPARLRALLPDLDGARCLADIACDHGRLAAAAVLGGHAGRAVGVDIAAGPLAGAAALVANLDVADRVSLRRGDGLAALRDGEADVAVIAGVGGRLVAAMLRAAGPSVRDVARLVLSPHGDEAEVRIALAELGWAVRHERLVAERGRIYVQLVAEPAGGRPLPLDDSARWLGRLPHDADPALFRRWRQAAAERVGRERTALFAAGDDPARLALLGRQSRVLAAQQSHPDPFTPGV